MQHRYHHTLLLGLVFSGLALAPLEAVTVYKQVDKEGNVTFTDQPAEDAETEQVEIQPINVHSFPKAPPPEPKSQAPEKQFSYKTLNIVAPKNEDTLRDPGDILIRAELNPNLRSGHQVRFTDNGEPLNEPSRKLSLQLFNLYRGTHNLQAEVVNRKGEVLISSPVVTLYVHRNSIINNPATSSAPPGG